MIRAAGLALPACLLAWLALAGPAAAPVVTAELVSFNIRTAAAQDGANDWVYRAGDVAGFVLAREPDVVGFQEAEPDQVAFLAEKLDAYSRVGRSREVDAATGEAVPLFFHHGRWRLDPGESGTFWLSDTPAEPGSRSWGNRYPRIVTWARLVHRATGRGLYVFNLHLDHESEPSRVRSAKLVSRRAAERRHADPVIVMGDFNAPPGSTVLRTLQDELGLLDSYAAQPEAESAAGTYHAFTGDAAGRRIDFILVPEAMRILDAGIERGQRDGRYPSDHFPVTATIEF